MELEKYLKSAAKFKIKPGLDSIKKILELYNNPQDKLKCIHIAGTNGKGSCASIIESILLEDKKLNVAKFTSPHLFSYTERFSFNGQNIDEAELKSIIFDIDKKDKEHNIDLTEFEILTAAAFIYFEKKKADVVILETGLGGKFDSTNIIKNPLISIITSISYDHKDILGNSLQEIAIQKAGIFKKGSMCLFSSQNKAYETLKKEADRIGSIYKDICVNVELSNNLAKIDKELYEFSLNGDFQKENLELSLSCIKYLFDIDTQTVKSALKKVKWAFRMDKRKYSGHDILIDACHNVDGIRVLLDYLEKYQKNKKIEILFSCLNTKEYNKMLSLLKSSSYKVCFFEFDYKGALKFKDIEKIGVEKIENPFDEIEKGDYDLYVIAGSIYMEGILFKNKELN